MRVQAPSPTPRCIGKQLISRLILAGLNVARRPLRPEPEPPQRGIVEDKRQGNSLGARQVLPGQPLPAGHDRRACRSHALFQLPRGPAGQRAISNYAKDLIACGRDIVVVDPNAKSAAFGANVLDARTRRYGEFVPRPRAARIAPQHDESRSRWRTGPRVPIGLRRVAVPAALPERAELVADRQHVSAICGRGARRIGGEVGVERRGIAISRPSLRRS